MQTAKPSIIDRLANALFAGPIERATTAALTVRIDDSPGWEPLTPAGPHDRDYSEWLQDQQDALEAWRKNFLIRRIVTLTRSYVLGGGISISSDNKTIDSFIQAFINHPKNTLDKRYGQMCDELTRAGELFPLLFTNPTDGMSYVRFIPASEIIALETDPDDYETELGYRQRDQYDYSGKLWLAPDNPDAWEPDEDGRLPPLMLHFAVNRPIGATRGEGDLGPILKWCLRYSNWLEDRVRLNRIRTRQQLLEIELADDTKVKERKRQVQTEDPVKAGIYVHGPGEVITAHRLEIGGADAAPDGKALRLAVASGANTALHYMGEGESANYATAREMGEPTARFYTERQGQLTDFLTTLVTIAYQRKVTQGLARQPKTKDLKLRVVTTETARADNSSLAEATKNVVEALAQMRQHNWVDDATATRLAFKFAGEAISEEDVQDILAGPPLPTQDTIKEDGPNA